MGRTADVPPAALALRPCGARSWQLRRGHRSSSFPPQRRCVALIVLTDDEHRSPRGWRADFAASSSSSSLLPSPSPVLSKFPSLFSLSLSQSLPAQGHFQSHHRIVAELATAHRFRARTEPGITWCVNRRPTAGSAAGEFNIFYCYCDCRSLAVPGPITSASAFLLSRASPRMPCSADGAGERWLPCVDDEVQLRRHAAPVSLLPCNRPGVRRRRAGWQTRATLGVSSPTIIAGCSVVGGFEARSFASHPTHAMQHYRRAGCGRTNGCSARGFLLQHSRFLHRPCPWAPRTATHIASWSPTGPQSTRPCRGSLLLTVSMPALLLRPEHVDSLLTIAPETSTRP